jgi:hypothetical protein
LVPSAGHAGGCGGSAARVAGVDVRGSTSTQYPSGSDSANAIVTVGTRYFFGDAFIRVDAAGSLYQETLNLYNPAAVDVTINIKLNFFDGFTVSIPTIVRARPTDRVSQEEVFGPFVSVTTFATDEEALKAFHDCCQIEGIIPALESSHALAHAARFAPTLGKDKIILVNLSGRGDKDLHIVAEAGGLEFFCRASCREATLAFRKGK